MSINKWMHPVYLTLPSRYSVFPLPPKVPYRLLPYNSVPPPTPPLNHHCSHLDHHGFVCLGSLRICLYFISSLSDRHIYLLLISQTWDTFSVPFLSLNLSPGESSVLLHFGLVAVLARYTASLEAFIICTRVRKVRMNRSSAERGIICRCI